MAADIEKFNLNATEKTVVQYIASHPGVISREIADGLGARHDSTSAVLANIVRHKPGLLSRTQEAQETGGAQYRYRLSNGAGDKSDPLRVIHRKVKRNKPRRAAKLDVLITVKLGRRESETLTIDEARDLLHQLLAVQRFFADE